jgi:hypothetical protein
VRKKNGGLFPLFLKKIFSFALVIFVLLCGNFFAYAENLPDTRSRKEVVITLAVAEISSLLRDFTTVFGFTPTFVPNGDYKRWLIDGNGVRYIFDDSGFPNGRFIVNPEFNFFTAEEKKFTNICCNFLNGLYYFGGLDSKYYAFEAVDGVTEYFFNKSFLKELEIIGRKSVTEEFTTLYPTHDFHFSPDFRIAEYGISQLQVGNYIFESSPYFPDWQTVEINALRISSTDYQMGKYFGIMPYFVDNGAIFLPYSSAFDSGLLYNRYSNFFMPFYFYTLGGFYVAYPSGGFTYYGSKLFSGFQPADYQGLQIQYGNFVRGQTNFFGKISVSGDGNENYFGLTKDFYNTQTKEKVDVFDYPNAVKALRYAVLPYSESPTNDEIILDAVQNFEFEEEFEPVSEIPFSDFISDTIPDDAVISVDTNGKFRVDGEEFDDIPPEDFIPSEPENPITEPETPSNPSVPGLNLDVNVDVNSDGIINSISQGFSYLVDGLWEMLEHFLSFLHDLLFPPPDLFIGAINDVKAIIDSKIGFFDTVRDEYVTLFELFSSASTAYGYGGAVPDFQVNFSFLGENFSLKLLDFEMFSGAIELFRSFVVVFVYLRFILHFHSRIVKLFSPVTVVMKG